MHLGYRVAEKSDVLAALTIIEEGGAVDLVMTDYRMPGMDGLELLAN